MLLFINVKLNNNKDYLFPWYKNINPWTAVFAIDNNNRVSEEIKYEKR